MGIANIPKWTFISIILAVILIIRGIFDSNVSLILGIIISLLTIILFIGIPSLLMKKSEKGYRFKNNSGPLKFQIKHFGLGHQIFDNTGLGILLILLLIMDFGVYISIPLVNVRHFFGFITILIISSILALVCHLLYVYDLRVHSLFYEKGFSNKFSYLEKRVGIIQMFKYEDIKEISYKKNTIRLKISNNDIDYYIENFENKENLIDFLRMKANLPILGLDENNNM